MRVVSSNGQRRTVEVEEDDGRIIRFDQNLIRSGKWRKVTQRGTLDHKAIILAVKDEYTNFNK